MKKFLGIGFNFGVKDQGVNKFLDKTNNQIDDIVEGSEEASNVKPKKGSFLNAISEIAKLGLLKNISQGIQDYTSGVEDASKAASGRGLSDEFKTVESLTKRVALQIGDAGKAAILVDKTVSRIVIGAQVTADTATDITGAFVKNNLNLEKNQKLLLKTARFTKAFGLNAEEVANSFAFGTKTLGLTKDGLDDIINKATLLEAKTGLSGLAGNLPNVIELVQKQIEKGIITKGQAKVQIQRIQGLVTAFRNTGVDASKAQGFVEGLTSNIENVTEAFAKIRAGEGSSELASLSSSFGKLGIDIGRVQKSFQSGNINAAFSEIISAGQKAKKFGGQDLQAFNLLIKETFGEEALGVIASASTKAFGQAQAAISGVNKTLREGKGAQAAKKIYNTLNDTIENQELALKGLNEEFERGASKSISASMKEYNRFKIGLMKNLADGNEANDGFFENALMGIKKLQQGGLVPFLDTFAKIPGVSKDSAGKMIAAFETFSPIIKDSADEVFFLTGTLANLTKLSPSPLQFMKDFGAKTLEVGKDVFDFGKKLLISNKAQKAFAIGSKLVGVGIRFMLGPVGLIIAGIAAVSAGLIYAYKNSETFRGVVDGLWESMKGFGQTIYDIGAKYLPPLWEGVKKAAKFWANWLNPIGLVYNMFKKLVDLFPNFFKGLKDKVMAPINKLARSLKNSTIGKIFGELFGGKKTISVASKTVTQQAPENKPRSVAETVTSPNARAQFEASSSAGGGTAYAPNAAQRASQMDETQSGAQSQSSKHLAAIFSMVGADIISAINAGKNTVEISLKGDARKLFQAQNRMTGNRAVAQGVTG